MCRLLLVKSENEFEIDFHLKKLAEIAKNSKEFQGHGWGCSYLINNNWSHYKNLKPIWEDNFDQFGNTKLLIAHARSAFQDKGIKIENNMPFTDGNYIYIFNGELRGVKIKEEGRIGAEKIFNFIKKCDIDLKKALEIGIDKIKKRTKYVRALNLIITDKEKIYAACNFNEDPDYFNLQYKEKNDQIIICSETYPNEKDWKKMKNNSIVVFK